MVKTMGLTTVKCVNKVMRATFNLYPGDVRDIPEKEARTLIKRGDVTEVKRTPETKTATRKPRVERAVRKARGEDGGDDS